MWSFDFFKVSLNKLFNKLSNCPWSEIPWHSCEVTVMIQQKVCTFYGIYCGWDIQSVRWPLSWWRHQMETFSALLAIFAGNSPVTGELPAQRPVTQGFDVFFDLHLNKRLSKQSWGWWFETLSCPSWHHCNVLRGHMSITPSHQLRTCQQTASYDDWLTDPRRNLIKLWKYHSQNVFLGYNVEIFIICTFWPDYWRENVANEILFLCCYIWRIEQERCFDKPLFQIQSDV